MSHPVIRVENLGKEYIIGGREKGNETFREMLTNSLAAPFRRLRRLKGAVEEEERFWALKDVSFEVQRGEVVGIIGRNGAGKSTLLKILSRITEPTEGEVEIRGRVASLLEVGTGFHPELTGRENIYLNGAILGMSRAEIDRKFDDIVAFAEVEKFLNTPVKRYSSGMYVRLAFAVAAHLEPEILIVDEVLAVGDAAFQKKCLGKMGAVAKEGRTVLFVSHNMNAISNLCGKVILLLNGRVENYGAPRKMIDKYLSMGITNIMRWQPSIVLGKAFFFNAVWIDLNRILIESGGLIAADSPFEVFFEFHVLKDINPGRLAIKILNQEGVVIFSAADTDETPYLNHSWLLGRHVISCVIPGNFLTPGRYYLSVAVSGKENSLIIHENVLTFTISENGSLTVRDGRPGVIAPKLRWKTHDV